MTTYRAIAATETDPQAPITSALVKALQNNLLAVLERDGTAPDLGASIALSATGSVGSYALLRFAAITTASPGSTHAGSSLRYANVSNTALGTAASGTWRLMGETTNVSVETSTSVFLRIS